MAQRPRPHPDVAACEPTDADVDLRAAGPRRHRADDATVLSVIAAGGALGAAGRYLLGQAWPSQPGAFPLTTLTINVVGCALIGVLMVLVSDVWTGQRLLRPFLGTGLLGGFTTFSTYAVDIEELTTSGHLASGLLYLAVTLVAALLAVWGGAAATRRVAAGRST